MKTNNSEIERLAPLDLMRGLAIFGVLVVHTSQVVSAGSAFDALLAFGRFGVQLFFLVSAYTMCYMWDARIHETNRQRKFYIRRVLRIVPLFWLAIPVYLLLNGASSELWTPDGRGVLQVLLTATFLHGFVPSAISTVVPGGWSIAAEMTFYLIFPLIATYVRDWRLLLWAAFATYFINTLWVSPVLLSALNPHYLGTAQSSVPRDFVYLNPLNQAPVFLLGCLLYRARFMSSSQLRQVGAFLSLWLVAAFFAYHQITQDARAFGFIGIVLVLCVLFYALHQSRSSPFMPLVVLGRFSYGMYLSHFFVLAYLPSFGIKQGPVYFVLGLCIVLSLSFLIARALNSLVERPAARWAAHLTREAEPVNAARHPA